MTFNAEQINAMIEIVNKRGMAALKNAKDMILLYWKEDSSLAKALQYVSNVTLQDALPVFPALISLSCEAVGGNPEKTVPFGEAIVLISAAADLHDDIIDKSFTKGDKQTVLGKFGRYVALLAGDALLSHGIMHLCRESKRIETEKGNLINNLLMDGITEICVAEGLEGQLRERYLDASPDEYSEVIRHKAVVPGLAMKIGAILGNGSSRYIAALGQIGRTYGIGSMIIEEFADIFEPDELRNRLKNGCPPLPLIYALHTPESRKALLPLLVSNFPKRAHDKIIQFTINSCEVQRYQKTITSLINNELLKIRQSAKWKKQGEIEILLRALLDSVNHIYSFS
ncbi:MAG TPA: polyprenyl synthetase family protein [Candidatus Sulfotelmatobacter sp.]|nr:polyprenyl synthetase family protein [Candidatus Sulfotelmatobacter sp.]